MTDETDKTTEPLLHCDVCLKEIPGSVAKSLEGPDYVYHFCGAECYTTWEKQKHRDRDANK